MSNVGTRPAPKGAEFDADFVRDVSEAVYRQRMGETDANELTEKIGATKFRDHASSYDALTRCYLRTLRITATLGVVNKGSFW